MLFQSALTLESIFSPNFFNQHVTPQWVQRLAFELVYMQRYPDLAQRLVGAFKSCVTLMVCAHVLFVGQHHGQAQQQRKQSRLQHKQESSWAHHMSHLRLTFINKSRLEKWRRKSPSATCRVSFDLTSLSNS